MSSTLAPGPAPVSAPALMDDGGVASWSPATRVRAGLGAADLVGTETAVLGRRALIVTDATLTAGAAVTDARTRCAFARVQCALYDDVRPDPGLDAVIGAVAAIRDSRAQVVVGIGGGSVLDVAKTAAWAARNPQLLEFAELGWEGGLARPDVLDVMAPRPALDTVMLPSTVGTGAEVSAVSCLSCPGDPHKRLVIHPALHPTLALVDPALTRTLPRRLALQGAFETFTRLLVPYLTDDEPRPLQDEMTFAILRTIVAQGRRVARDPDDAARLSLSLATVASHVAWANTGRPVGGHVLWYLGNPVSPAAGVDKVSAIAALTPAYLCAVCRGAHERLGRPGRLGRVGAEVLGADGTPAAACAALVELLDEWDLPTSLPDLWTDLPPSLSDVGTHLSEAPEVLGALDPDSLTDAALALWGDPELLGAVPADVVRDTYRAALRSSARGGHDNGEECP